MAKKNNDKGLITIALILLGVFLLSQSGSVDSNSFLSRDSPMPLYDGWDAFDLVINNYDTTPYIGSNTQLSLYVYPRYTTLSQPTPYGTDYSTAGTKYVQCSIFDTTSETWLNAISSTQASRFGVATSLTNCVEQDISTQTFIVNFNEFGVRETVNFNLFVPDYGANANYVIYCSAYEQCSQDGTPGYSDQFTLPISPRDSFMNNNCGLNYDEGDWRCTTATSSQQCIDFGSYLDWTDADNCDSGDTCNPVTGRCEEEYIFHDRELCYQNNMWWYDSLNVIDTSDFRSCGTVGCVTGAIDCRCVDVDGDGYGTFPTSLCSASDANVWVDCNDANAGINHGETDIPNNGVDEDCSGGDAVSGSDVDGDGILDVYDNCVNVPNQNQLDSDDDDVGDACETFNPPTPIISGDDVCYYCSGENEVVQLFDFSSIPDPDWGLSGMSDDCEDMNQVYETTIYYDLSNPSQCLATPTPPPVSSVIGHGDYLEEEATINTANADEWCINDKDGITHCFERKKGIFLNEIVSEIDDIGRELKKMQLSGEINAGIGLFSEYWDVAVYVQQTTEPICYNAWGDNQCVEGSKCLPAKNNQADAYKDNLAIYESLYDNVLDAYFGWEPSWLTTNANKELYVEKFGACVLDDHSSSTQFKQWVADLFGLSIDDPTVNYIIYGGVALAIVLLFAMFSPPRR